MDLADTKSDYDANWTSGFNVNKEKKLTDGDFKS
jgi:hypothetical protein